MSVCPHGSFPCSETLCNATVTLNGPDKVQEETCHPLKAMKRWRMKLGPACWEWASNTLLSSQNKRGLVPGNPTHFTSTAPWRMMSENVLKSFPILCSERAALSKTILSTLFYGIGHMFILKRALLPYVESDLRIKVGLVWLIFFRRGSTCY